MNTDHLRELLAKATPGKWIVDPRSDFTIVTDHRPMRRYTVGWLTESNDVSLIVAAVNALPDLLATIDRLTGELAEARWDADWNPIETAPRNTEVLVWRSDSGVFIARLATPDAVFSDAEMEREELEFPDDFEEWWCDAYGWQEGAEKPTHWMPLPPPPTGADDAR